MARCPQLSHCSMCPPSAAVRHATNGAQDFEVQSGQPAAMLSYESCAIVPNNVGHLQRRPNHFSEGFLIKFKLSRGLAVARTWCWDMCR